MRLIIIQLLLFCLSLTISAQELYETELTLNEKGKVEFTEVVNVDGSPNELYSKAKQWVATTFLDVNDEDNKSDESGKNLSILNMKFNDVMDLTMDDSEAGKIIGNGITNVTILDNHRIYFIFSLFAREGRYKYTFTILDLHRYPSAQTIYTKYPAEKPLVETLYKSNGKVNRSSANKKEKVITKINELILDLKSAMEATEEDW